MGATVLVVDDDREIRSALADILRDEGYVVREACDGMEALESIAVAKPDLLLLDLMMPVMNGWEVLQSLRRSGGDLPVVVLSAVPLRMSGIDHVTKPVKLDQLLLLIDTIRARSQESDLPPD
jgi:DNA-binding response OmpR family regulator